MRLIPARLPHKASDAASKNHTLFPVVFSTVCIAALLAQVTNAQTTNLPTGYYPAHACGEKPAVPNRPTEFETQAQLETYNAQVDSYNTLMSAFVECIQRYVDAGQHDISAIRTQLQHAIDSVNN